MTNTIADQLATLIPSLGAPRDLKVVTATIVAANADVATLRTADGAKAIMAVTEFYPGRRWAVNEKYQLLQISDETVPQLSAVRPELINALLEGLSPEVRSGTVAIKKVARSAGVRTKIAVAATAADIDPVAACVGRGANRVKALSSQLAGERIDVIAWHPNLETYLSNALAPATAERIEITGDKAVASVHPHMMSAAVGNGGLNSSLAGLLTGLQVTIGNC